MSTLTVSVEKLCKLSGDCCCSEASAIELPLPVKRFPVYTCINQVKPMEKPTDRRKQAELAGSAELPADPIPFSWPPLGIPLNMSVGH